MFPSEERRQIEEEEQKQAAGEKYRAEVRAGLDRPTLTEMRKWTRIVRVVLGLVLAATILAALIVNALMSNRRANRLQHPVPLSSGVH
jgi:hypothetical protein